MHRNPRRDVSCGPLVGVDEGVICEVASDKKVSSSIKKDGG